ncbi:hypothetical protein ACFWYW_17070 [Nonomuraea sp. NPDC059023]
MSASALIATVGAATVPPVTDGRRVRRHVTQNRCGVRRAMRAS